MMREKIDQLVRVFETSLNDGSATPATFDQAVAEIQALEPITELDRLYRMAGMVKLLDVLLSRLPSEEGQALREQRAILAAVVERQFGGSNPAYARSRDIVQEVAIRLKSEKAETVVDAATAEINALPFDAADEGEKAIAVLAVNALRAATDWVAAYDDLPNKLDPLPLALKMFAAAFDVGGFDKDVALKCTRGIRDDRLSLDGTQRGYASALMVGVGLALRAEPLALPALAEPMSWLVEALTELQAEGEGGAVAAQAPWKAPVAQFEKDLQEHGFTEYHFRQAMAALQELTPANEEEGVAIREAVLRLIDLAQPHAPREFAEMLPIVRRQIIAQAEPAGSPIDAATFETEGKALVDRLRTALAGGTSPGAAFIQAQSDLQSLGRRVRDEDGEAMTRTMLQLLPQLVAAMVPYAEKGKETLASDVADMMRRAMAHAEGALAEDSGEAELAGRAALQTFQSVLEQPLGDPFEQSGAPTQHRQFAALVRSMSERMMRINGNRVLTGRDAAEFERIESRMKVAFDRLRAATSEAQWIEQQRGSLRPAVVHLRRFERRHHLMVISPPWTGPKPTINANAIFVSGGPTVQNLVDITAPELGYEALIALNVNESTHTRWDLLSRSAIAVFDFTSYDRGAADPPGEFPSSPATVASIAQAAAATARASYECGWAFVLGVPMVIVAREGQAVPFDIDVEPVRLTGDAADRERLGVALQAALFGIQRGVSAEGLSRTINHLKNLAAGNETATRLIAAATEAADATSIRLAAEGVVERLDGRGLILALPAFPPAYPADGQKSLFHVTAFRPWSEACQDVVKEACGNTVEHRIGYERFDPDILRSIWNDIATSSYVVADLTHLNPNAVLELAIAQAFGRPTLVVSQTPNLHEYLPALAKTRIHHYTTDGGGLRRLRAVIDRFLKG